MNIETDKIVSAEEFLKHWGRYRAMARRGSGPIAVTEKDEVIGVFIGAEEYETMFGEAVKELLKRRMKGSIVTQEEVQAGVERIFTETYLRA
jgi:hypothetical protein